MKRALISQNLHTLLQLHRIAAEETSNQRFKGTMGLTPVVEGNGPKDAGIVPVYGVIYKNERDFGEATESPGTEYEEVKHRPIRSDSRPYATMLRDPDVRLVYDVEDVR